MHAEPGEHAAATEHGEPAVSVLSPLAYPEARTRGEWAVGAVFVLAAVALVAWIAWTIITL